MIASSGSLVGSHDISSMFPHICLHYYLLIVGRFTYPFYLRAHTSFMLSSGWTSSPSQVLARGRIVFPWHSSILLGGHPAENPAFFPGIVLALDYWLDANYISVLTALALFSLVGCTSS